MGMTASDAPTALCSELSAARGLPLIGTAGCYAQVLAFELESPWTARLAGSRGSDARLDAAIGRIAGLAEVRLLALEPRRPARRDVVRVLSAVRRERFPGYGRTDYEVSRDRLPDLLDTLASGGEAPQASALPAGAWRDLLVCTHGTRDACCGKFGYRLYRELDRLAAAAGEQLRVWRCSHLGGHRFAPTLLELPSGRTYGRVGADDAPAIVSGGAALVARLDTIYRGRCALPEPAQIVERELWRRTGAAFDRAALRWSVDRRDDGAWSVELEAELDDESARLSALVDVAEVDAVSTPASCGRDPEREAPWALVG